MGKMCVVISTWKTEAVRGDGGFQYDQQPVSAGITPYRQTTVDRRGMYQA